MRRIIALSLLTALIACTAPTTPVPATGPAASRAAPTGDFATRINGVRQSRGLGTIVPNTLLRQAAQAHADDMARRGYFAHRAPEGTRADRRIARTGYKDCGWSENIAEGLSSEASVFSAWQASPGHNRNMLGSIYTEYGLARAGQKWVLVLAKGC